MWRASDKILSSLLWQRTLNALSPVDLFGETERLGQTGASSTNRSQIIDQALISQVVSGSTRKVCSFGLALPGYEFNRLGRIGCRSAVHEEWQWQSNLFERA